MSDQFPHLSCVWSDPFDWDGVNANLQVPDEPGFYAFTDHAGPLQVSVPGKQVLYIGIATQSLRERIKKYKAGDKTGARGLMNMHAGGFFMLLSRADAAHYGDGRVTHSVQKTPVPYTVKAAGQPPRHGVLTPNSIYLRWSVDYRAAIEALLIQQLNPKFNTMLVQE